MSMAGAPSAPDFKVLVVSEDPLARGGLASMLAMEPGVEVTGIIGPSATELRNAPGHDACAWDVGQAGVAGLDRLRDLGAGAAPVVALVEPSVHPADALGAGARGVMPRATDGGRLAAALRASAQGLIVVDPGWEADLASGRPAQGRDVLSPREHEVLDLLAEGHPNKIIADRLGISDHTAKFHINSIFAKLGATSRTEAVVRAVRAGLLAL
jgi:DNA-binding NarL/FixJ family response regulator